MKCDGCGTSAFDEVREVTLIGRYYVCFCRSCQNDWHEYATSHELWEQQQKVDVRTITLKGRAIAGSIVVEPDWKKLRHDSNALIQKWNRLARDWITERQAKREKATES